LVTFCEGNTISYAVDSKDQPISSDSDLWPFTPFAWTSENVSPPRPFILFYDPTITCNSLECHAPIFIHGGFTAAFYEFGGDETGGTGRLIVSMACWLTRLEVREQLTKLFAVPIGKTVPRLGGNYVITRRVTFPLKPIVSVRRHSILCLDVSGSTTQDYPTLARAANDYITIQRQGNGLLSIAQFSDTARILYEQPENRMITAQEGFTGGNIDFSAPLQMGLQVANRNPSGYECRIVFFTDGQANIPSLELQILQKAKIRMDVVGCGSVQQDILNQMVTCGGQVSIGATIREVREIFRQIAATD
jgi:hypothetical protein